MQANNLTWDHDNPLAFATFQWRGDGKWQKEPKKANQALADYCWLGQARSQTGLIEFYNNRVQNDPLYRPPTLNKAFVATWSMNYAWVERAARFDEMQQERRQQQEEQFWAEARKAVPLRDYAQAEKLRELVDKTLAQLADFVEENEQTRGTVTVINRRVDLRAVIDALRLSSQLQRLAAGLDQSQSGVTKNFNIDLSMLPTEYLQRIVDGENENDVMSDYVTFVMEKMREMSGGGPIDVRALEAGSMSE